jgi:signal transduction histidine kinase
MQVKVEKRLIGFLIIIIIFILIVPFSYFSFNKIQNFIIEKNYSNLMTSREIKKHQIQDFFSQKVSDIEVLAHSSDIKNLFKAIMLKNNLQDKHKRYIKKYIQKYGYMDMFLLHAKNGNILYNQSEKINFGHSLKSDNLKNSGLDKVWEKVREHKRTAFADMQLYKYTNNTPVMFVGTPLYVDNKLQAILVLQIADKGLSKIMNFRVGYGLTQEDYLVGEDKLMRSDSYLCPSTHSLKSCFLNTKKGTCDTTATREALSGKKGEKMLIDYNGNLVLSAYSPIYINHDLKWAILSEIEQEEVLIIPKKIQKIILIYTTIFISILILIILFIINKMFKYEKEEAKKTKHMNANLQKINKKLAESEYKVILENENLEIKVDQEIAKNKQNQTLLFQQSKMASMGEMIGNIAHQWRQPLNALSALNLSLSLKHERGRVPFEDMDIFETKSNIIIQGMSKTIDDFRNFFAPNKECETFMVKEVIEETIHFIQAAYTINNIQLINKSSSTIKIQNHKNELIQVLLNLFNNAKDAITEFNPKHGLVIINIVKSENSMQITLEDNGGGINQKIIDRVFEPYFTTKFKDEGTGIGLYMSKMIVEESMYGKLKLENHKNGVLASITLPLISEC